MDFIKNYMTDAGQVPKIEGEEVKLLFLEKLKSRAVTVWNSSGLAFSVRLNRSSYLSDWSHCRTIPVVQYKIEPCFLGNRLKETIRTPQFSSVFNKRL